MKKFIGSRVMFDHVSTQIALMSDQKLYEFISESFLSPFPEQFNKILDIDRYILSTKVLSSKMFVTFASLPLYFLYLDKINPRSGQNTRHVVLSSVVLARV
eukprot:TRINITY_DN3166_c0_g1_i3.p1 TRINITY_DN3166_c0_g1~~TRINITY_DN3166_c0_g1_i3.p1  ORF type:complete len:101 (+),score=3.63 TRINITY_DN3166_c0_g1_i3:270-572(+)